MKCIFNRVKKDDEHYFLINKEWREYLSDSTRLDFYLSETTKCLDNLQDTNILLSNRLVQIIGWNIVFITALMALLFKSDLTPLIRHTLSGSIIFLVLACFVNLLGHLPAKSWAKGIMPEVLFQPETLEYIKKWYKDYNKETQQTIFILESYNTVTQELLKQNSSLALKIKISMILLMLSVLFLGIIVSLI